MIKWTEDERAYYVWKPSGVPSTFGKEYSFLEELMDKRPPFFVQLMDEFSRDEEFGLLNRLDNATAGFLYFAKNHESKTSFKHMIESWTLHKVYLCKVKWIVDMQYYTDTDRAWRVSVSKYINSMFWEIVIGEVSFFADVQNCLVDKGVVISSPIMHSKSSMDRMIVIKNDRDSLKWRWQLHQVKTTLYPVHTLLDEKSTICVVVLEWWMRHQIRAHVASIWHPVIGDEIYGKKSQGEGGLELYSVGVRGDECR